MARNYAFVGLGNLGARLAARLARILDGSYDTGFSFDLALKDLGLVQGLARDLDVPLKLSGPTIEMLDRARSRFGGGAWTAHVVKMMADELGISLTSPAPAPAANEVVPGRRGSNR